MYWVLSVPYSYKQLNDVSSAVTLFLKKEKIEV